MLEIRQTDIYRRWFLGLRDPEARARILVRLRRLSLGNRGDARTLRNGVCELRIDHGPGYRVYFKERPEGVVTLLIGGTKKTQAWDVQRAYGLLEDQ